MDTIKNLVNYDIILLSRIKKSNLISLVLLIVISVFMVFTGGVMISATVMLIMAIIPTNLFFDAEKNGGCEQVFGIIPVSRKDVVISRFLMTGGFLTAVLLILNIVMEIYFAMGSDDTTIIELLEKVFGLDTEKVSFKAFSRLFLGVFYALSMNAACSTLRKFFKNGTKKKSSLIVYFVIMYIIIEIVGFVIIVLNTSNVPVVQVTVSVLASVFNALLEPMDGIILFITAIIIGFGCAIYHGVCAYIEYDKREL